MGNAASAAPLKMDKMKDYKPKDRANFNFQGPAPECRLGDQITVTVTGKVTSLRQDEYGKSLELEMTGMKKYEEKKK